MAMPVAAFVVVASFTSPHQARLAAPHASRPGSPLMVQPMTLPRSLRDLSKTGRSSVSQFSATIGCVFLALASAKGRRSRSLRSMEGAGAINALAIEVPKPHCLGASSLAGSGAPRQSRTCKVAMFAGSIFSSRSIHEDENAESERLENEDGPDRFFAPRLNKDRRRRLVPAWSYDAGSPTKRGFGQDIVYFFPRVDQADPEQDGFVKFKMYKKKELTKREKKKEVQMKARSWRTLTNKLQNEWRYKRIPRDDSGNIIPGKWNGKNSKSYIGRAPIRKLKHRSAPVR